MNRHSINRQRQEAEKTILEENREWIDNFMQENYPGYQRRQEPREKQKVKNHRLRTIWFSIGSSMAAMVIIVVTLIFTWPLMFPVPPPNPPDPPKKYLTENEVSVKSDLTELNADLEGFIIMLDTGYEDFVLRTYDSEYGDTLYYEVTIINEDTVERITIYAYVNSLYEHQGETSEQNITASVGGFTIKYSEEVQDEGWAFTLICYAKFEYNDSAIYIDYKQLSLDEESNFFDFFEQAFQKTV